MNHLLLIGLAAAGNGAGPAMVNASGNASGTVGMDAAGDAAIEALDAALNAALGSGTSLVSGSTANALVFLLIAALGLLMALVYVPLRLFLTLTARSRRLRLLQRIRRLREELGRPVTNA